MLVADDRFSQVTGMCADQVFRSRARLEAETLFVRSVKPTDGSTAGSVVPLRNDEVTDGGNEVGSALYSCGLGMGYAFKENELYIGPQALELLHFLQGMIESPDDCEGRHLYFPRETGAHVQWIGVAVPSLRHSC